MVSLGVITVSQGIGVSLLLVQGLVGVYSILISWGCQIGLNYNIIVQGIGVSLLLVQGLVGVYSILISSWMFVYFR